MAAEDTNIGQILFDIPVKTEDITEVGLNNLELQIVGALEAQFGPFEKVLSQSFGTQPYATLPKPWLIILTGRQTTTLTIKTYPVRAFVTVTLEYDLLEFGRHPPLKYEAIKDLESDLAAAFGFHKRTRAIPEIKRVVSKDIYFTTSDERLVEYDVQEMLFDERSKFQHVQIARTLNYGNTLILDGNINMSDSDVSYTEALMAPDLVTYEDKEILILGGGDGGLLAKLREKSPRSITMVEIDEVVMKGCRRFMRDTCRDTLDDYNKGNIEILVGDCVEFMEACRNDGKKYDVVFGDLTEIPISTAPQGKPWDFLRHILNMAMTVLNDDGWYLTHGNGMSVPKALEMYEREVLTRLYCPVAVHKSAAFVPSFMEKWVFYRIQKVMKLQRPYRV